LKNFSLRIVTEKPERKKPTPRKSAREKEKSVEKRERPQAVF